MSNPQLFDDFPPISTKDWEEQIRRDLRGADYGEALLWHLPDGVTVRPYYRAEDVAELEHPEARNVAIPSRWQVRQDIRTPDMKKAADHARAALNDGAEVLGIDLRVEDGRCHGVPVFTSDDLAELLDYVSAAGSLSDTALHLAGGPFSLWMLACYLERMPDAARAVSLQFDPIAESAHAGRRADRMLDATADTIGHLASESPGSLRVLSVGSSVFHEAGADPLHETALLLASLSESLVQMIKRGVPAERVVERLTVTTPIGSSYFVEIARLRALRLVLRRLIDIFVPDESVPLPPIHGETSPRNSTLFDPHENMLRSATEAASAVIGGCDVVAVHPFDSVGGRLDAFSYRMARNVQHILRHEAGFGEVVDPAAGSYYVEVLTDAFARRMWQLFQDIEAEGGFFEALDSGFIHRPLEASAARLRQDVAERRRILVGTNHYPDSSERRSNAERLRDAGQEIGAQDVYKRDVTRFADLRQHAGAGGRIVGFDILDEPQLAEPLRGLRAAEEIERRRLRTERHPHDVRVLLIPFGDPAVRSARAHVAANVLGCGGFSMSEARTFDSPAEMAETILSEEPDVVVFCAPDDAYAGILSKVNLELGSTTKLPLTMVVARPEVSDELDASHFDLAIHRGSNLLTLIDAVHRHVGIDVEPSTEATL